MDASQPQSSSSPLNLRRLVWLRSIAIPGAAIALLLAGRFYNLPIRVAPLLTIVFVLALVNFWTFRRLQTAGAIPHAEFFTQIILPVSLGKMEAILSASSVAVDIPEDAFGGK